MERTIYQLLMAWKNSPARKPLILKIQFYGAVLLDCWQSYLLFRSTPVIGRKWVNLPE